MAVRAGREAKAWAAWAGGGAGDATGGGGEGGAAPMPGCLPVEGLEIAADCGVYVAVGGGGLGTKTSPFPDLATALDDLAGPANVYVCGAPEHLGSVTLPAGVSIVGGLDCATWVYSVESPRPSILGDEGIPALTIEGDPLLETSLWSLDIEAPSVTVPGESSIGVFIRANATVTMAEVSIVTGDAVAAAPPPAMAPQASPAPSGSNGRNGGFAPMPVGSGTNTCDGLALRGGNGGAGGDYNAANPGGGFGADGDSGAGAIGGAGQNAFNLCFAGTAGSNGAHGAPGSQQRQWISGTLTEGGWVRADGLAGGPAAAGSSGGGGGGSRADVGSTTYGAGGGSGGTAGCGGGGGQGGQAGGSSIGLASFDAASVDLGSNVIIRVGAAGSGGAGQIGQPGQDGGAAGLGGNPNPAQTVAAGCPGGAGGRAGDGGNGAGGDGGSSIGIAHFGEMPTGGVVDLSSAGVIAAGGPGAAGNNALPGAPGRTGVHEERRQLY